MGPPAELEQPAGEDGLHAEHVIPRDPVLDRAQAPAQVITLPPTDVAHYWRDRAGKTTLFVRKPAEGQRIDARLDDRHKIFTGNINQMRSMSMDTTTPALVGTHPERLVPARVDG